MDYLNNFMAFEADAPTDLQVYQAMVKYSITPTAYEKRFLLKFSTGAGKTYSALLAL